MKLLIRNLARSITEDQVKELFAAHGAVQSCALVMDKKSGGSKGFGFVEMPKAGQAKAAMKALNGTSLEGSQIRVKKAEDRPKQAPDEAPSPAIEKAPRENPYRKN